jgi:uncharacterized protein YdeI (YjbR/CyaY-like superfamily)
MHGVHTMKLGRWGPPWWGLGRLGWCLLLHDKQVVLAAVAQDGLALQFAAEALRADKEFMLAAVAQNGRALYFAAEALRADKQVVLAAVTQNGLALQYA